MVARIQEEHGHRVDRERVEVTEGDLVRKKGRHGWVTFLQLLGERACLGDGTSGLGHLLICN